MQLEEYFDFLRPDDIRVHDHRVGIESILYEYVHRRRTAEQIQRRFPTLTLEQVYAPILYYLQHQTEIDAYLEDWLDHERRMIAEQERNPPTGLVRLRERLWRKNTWTDSSISPRSPEAASR